jgi:hypothetical protein
VPHGGKTTAAPRWENHGSTAVGKPPYLIYLWVSVADQGAEVRPARAATGRAEPATGRHRAGAEPLSDTTQNLSLSFFPL